MPHFKGRLWRLRNCRIIQLIVTVFNDRRIITATTYKFFCSDHVARQLWDGVVSIEN